MNPALHFQLLHFLQLTTDCQFQPQQVTLSSHWVQTSIEKAIIEKDEGVGGGQWLSM